MSVEEHLQDIDFRKREVRQSEAIKEICGWYEQLSKHLETSDDERIEAQLQAISAVLWLLMPAKAYKAFMKHKPETTKETEENIMFELKQMFRED